MSSIHRRILAAILVACAACAHAEEGSKHLAPGFTQRAAHSKLVIVPADMELFSISAGGVQEPRADWTDAAQKNFKAALTARSETMFGVVSSRIPPGFSTL